MQSVTQDMQKLTLSLFLKPYRTLPGLLSASVTLLLSQLSHSAPACTPGQQADLVLRIRNLKSLGKLASVKTRFETCKTDLDSYLHHLVGI